MKPESFGAVYTHVLYKFNLIYKFHKKDIIKNVFRSEFRKCESGVNLK